MSNSAVSLNYWPDTACAKAFWSQHESPAYQKLLADTTAWLETGPGQSWLDLGCGCGQLSRALWTKSEGSLAEVLGLDCAGVNEKPFARLASSLNPTPPDGAIQFVQKDFSSGLAAWPEARFDGIVSGMAIQYAESYSEEKGWTTEAYDHLLGEIHRVLKPGGWFVFSVNVPEPSWNRVALHSLSAIFRTRQIGRFLKNSLRMMRYGKWLKQEARTGRFHYLPLATVIQKLRAAGFTDIEHRLSYAKQAFLIRCRKA